MQTIEQFIAQLPEERQQPIAQLVATITKHLPQGFEVTADNGFINFVVPHSLYPKGYHCKPQQPLPFVALASQKNFISLYHMGIYADKALLDWFVADYPNHSTAKLDMGKSCIRFKKTTNIPFDLIGTLMEKMNPQQWIALYEESFIKK